MRGVPTQGAEVVCQPCGQRFEMPTLTMASLKFRAHLTDKCRNAKPDLNESASAATAPRPPDSPELTRALNVLMAEKARPVPQDDRKELREVQSILNDAQRALKAFLDD